MSSLTKPVEPLYPPDPLFALFNSSIPCEKGRDGVTMLRHWGLHETPESAVDLAPRGSISTSHSHRGNTFELEEIAGIDELQLRVTRDFSVDEINKILTEYTYMSAYERREGRDEQMKRFEESYEVIEQVGVPVDIGRFLRCAVSNDAFSIAEYLIHRDRNCVRWRDVLGRSPLVYAAALPSEKMLKLLSAQLDPDDARTAMSLQDILGNTVLHYAVWNSAAPEKLLDCEIMRHADPGIKNRKGNSVWETKDWPYRPNLRVLFKLAAMFCAPNLSHFPVYLVNLPKFVEKDTDRKVLWSDLMGPKMQAFVDTDRPNTPWMHIPWTNGYLIFTCLQALVDKSNLSGSHGADHFLNAFFGSLNIPGPGTAAGDPDLTSMVPSYNKHPAQKPESDVTFIIFPCLVLQDIGSFTASRRKFREYKNGLKKAGIVGDYVQIERTPDESHYPAASKDLLETRNKQQVVTRECMQRTSGETLADEDRPILMVPQFWIWKFADFVLSAYPPLGKDSNLENLLAPKDPEANKEFDLNKQSTIRSKEEMGADRQVATLLDDQIRRFGSEHSRLKYPSSLDIFERGVVRVLSDVVEYMKNKDLTEDNSGTELDLVNDIADIREELAMVDEILGQQDMVLEKFLEDMRAKSYRVSKEQSELRGETKRSNKEKRITREIAETIVLLECSKDLLHRFRDRIKKINNDAERIDKTVHDRLNLKRAFASIQDARTSLLFSLAVIGFTVVTIIFAPLAFMTALFALPIDNFQKHKNGSGNDAMFSSGFVAWTFAVAEISTIAVTGSLVWLFLGNQGSLAGGIRKYAAKSNKRSRQEDRKDKKTAGKAITEKTADTKTTEEASSSSSSLRRRLDTRPVAGLDAEERGERELTG